MKRIISIFVILLSLFLVSCKGESFEFLEKELSVYLYEEKDIPFKGGKDIVFEKSNDNILIDNTRIKGLIVGETIIKVSHKAITHELKVIVKPIFEFSVSEITLKIGEVMPIEYTLAEGYQLAIKPLDDIISYTDGKIKANYAGETLLTAEVSKEGVQIFTSINILVLSKTPQLEAIKVDVNNYLTVGETALITLTSSPLFYDKSGVIYSSSDETIFTIEGNIITALKAGSATLMATLEDKTDVIEITVKDKLEEKSVEIYYLNDLHGAIEPSETNLGLAYIANFIEQRRLENPNLILLAGGDMLQGSALSNYYQGQSTLTLMALMGFDAMVVGNHEFDWGLDVVTNQFSDEANVASFPLLGINIREKATNQRPKHIKPYTMIEKGDLKVGVIGAIGENIESSIANRFVKDYEFIEALTLIKDAAKTLRLSGADYILVMTHDYNTSLNRAMAELVGVEKIDAIFTAHSHGVVTEEVYNKPIIQSGAYGNYVGYVELKGDGTFDYANLKTHPDFKTFSPTVQAQIDAYKAETDDLFYNVIIKNRNKETTKTELSKWLVEVMKHKTGADIAFHNSGGTRMYLNANDEIHLAKLYQIWPFDNLIKTVKLKGHLVRELINRSYEHTPLEIDDDAIYVVVTHDYIFDYIGNEYIFSQGSEETITDLNIRDIAKEELQKQSLVYDYFEPTNPILTIHTFKERFGFLYI